LGCCYFIVLQHNHYSFPENHPIFGQSSISTIRKIMEAHSGKISISSDYVAFEAAIWKLMKRGADSEKIIQMLVDKGFDESFVKNEIPMIKEEIMAVKKRRATRDLAFGIGIFIFFTLFLSLFYYSVQNFWSFVSIVDDIIKGSLSSIQNSIGSLIVLVIVLGVFGYLLYRILRGTINTFFYLRIKKGKRIDS